MDLYLAGGASMRDIFAESNAENIPENDRTKHYAANGLYILESFYYMKNWMLPYIDKKVWNFMLDSGAFTFIKQKIKGVKSEVPSDWDTYVCRYADFILEHDINLFLELDIDVAVGLSRVEQLRKMLEARTGRQCIPVWHRSRGLDYWHGIAKDYQYIAVGGLALKAIHRHEHKYLNPLCDIAHEHDTRVHGLGISPKGRTGILRCRFDSVDSTNWMMGGRVGFIAYFDGKMIQRKYAPSGARVKAKEAFKHNFREWVKYQRYMLHADWRSR